MAMNARFLMVLAMTSHLSGMERLERLTDPAIGESSVRSYAVKQFRADANTPPEIVALIKRDILKQRNNCITNGAYGTVAILMAAGFFTPMILLLPLGPVVSTFGFISLHRKAGYCDGANHEVLTKLGRHVLYRNTFNARSIHWKGTHCAEYPCDENSDIELRRPSFDQPVSVDWRPNDPAFFKQVLEGRYNTRNWRFGVKGNKAK